MYPHQEKPLTAATVRGKKECDFDPKKFLATIGEERKVAAFLKEEKIFPHGDLADAVFYIQTGKVGLTAVSKTGQEGMIGVLAEGDFFGEGGLAGQRLRMGSATRCNFLESTPGGAHCWIATSCHKSRLDLT